MNTDTQEDPQPTSKSLGWGGIVWLLLIPVLYLLSSGPYVMMVDKKVILPNRSVSMVAGTFYRPLDWISRNTPLHRLLGLYWHLWAPGIYDSQGNPSVKDLLARQGVILIGKGNIPYHCPTER
jgi:hypothetical protein